MRFLGVCVGMVWAVVAAGVAGAGCHAGAGTLAGAGGGGTLSGLGGGQAGGRGGGLAILGLAGIGPVTGTAGYPSNGCGPIRPADPVPPKIVIVLDTSASMNDAPDGSCTGGCGSGSKWSAAVGGIDAVLGADGAPPVQWGLKFIGGAGDTCVTGGVYVGVAPDQRGTVIAALAGRTAAAQLAVIGKRPTRAAVAAATTHLLGLNAPSNTAILLMTDGQPDCAADDPRATDSAGALRAIVDATTAGIPTFVLGIGSLDPGTDDALSMMALGGGYPRSGFPAYYPVADAIDVVNTINQVVALMGACMFAIPPPPTTDGTTSRGDISVFAGGQPIFQDANNGWTYSDNTQTSVTLHGSSCDAILASSTQQVMIAFNCLV